jgi:hypothetical protein
MTPVVIFARPSFFLGSRKEMPIMMPVWSQIYASRFEWTASSEVLGKLPASGRRSMSTRGARLVAMTPVVQPANMVPENCPLQGANRRSR